MARFVRFWTGHFPHGAYRQRFRLPGRTACWCGHNPESRRHILFECPLWIRRLGEPTETRITLPRPIQRPTGFAVLSSASESEGDKVLGPLPQPRVQGRRRQRTPTTPLHFVPLKEVRWFLRANPMVATFEWYHLLDQAELVLAHGVAQGESWGWNEALPRRVADGGRALEI